MDGGREFRELLAADAALMLGVAEAPDVAAALQRYWARREQPGVTFESELAHIARLSPEALARIRAEVERLLGKAGGDAKAALTKHGGLDRSIHLALGKGGGDLTRALSVMGVSSRAPLRTLPEDRYVGFDAAGMGGMGIVYAALDTEMSRRVAFKMVRPHAERGRDEQTPSHPLEATRPPKGTPASEVFEQLEARLVQEAWVTGGLEHPGIVPVYEIGQTPTGIPYYTMRYVRGERTLADAIREKEGAPIEARLALLEPFLKVCDTLLYAHDKGVVHRDLKPANVALGQYGEVVLLDWGLARLEGREDVASSAWKERVEELRHDARFHTMEGGALGTAGYMAPEAALGYLAEVDQRSDVYSLGAMLFEILTGRLPFQFRSFAEYASLLLVESPPTARDVSPSVPEPLSALCARALASGKAQRPASAKEMSDAVRAWQVQDAADREVEALLRDARGALDAAETSSGADLLKQVERAAGLLHQAEERDPRREETRARREGMERLRARGLRERDRQATRRVLLRGGVVALVVATLSGFLVAGAVDASRREAEQARGDATRSLAELHADTGRREALAGRHDQALVHLEAAYALGRDSARDRFLLRSSLRHVELVARRVAMPELGANPHIRCSPDETLLFVSGEWLSRVLETATGTLLGQTSKFGGYDTRWVGNTALFDGSSLWHPAEDRVEALHGLGESVDAWTCWNATGTAWVEWFADGSARTRALPTGDIARALEDGGRDEPVIYRAWAGDTVVALGHETLHAWHAETGALRRRLSLRDLFGRDAAQPVGQRQPVTHACLRKDGARLFIFRDSALYEWDFEHDLRRLTHVAFHEPGMSVGASKSGKPAEALDELSPSPDGRSVVLVFQSGRIAACTAVPGSSGDEWSVFWRDIPDYRNPWHYRFGSTVHWRDDGAGFLLLAPSGRASAWSVRPLTFQADVGEGIAEAGSCGPLKQWLLIDQSAVLTGIRMAAVELVATLDRNARPDWEERSEPLDDPLVVFRRSPRCIFLSRRNLLATDVRRSQMMAVNLSDPSVTVGFGEPGASITCAELSSDERWLAVADREGKVAVWDTRSLEHGAVHEVRIPSVTSLAFSPRGDILACASSTGALHVLRLSSSSSMFSLEHGEPLRGAFWGMDGKVLAGVGTMGIQAWDVDRREVIWETTGEKVRSLAAQTRGHRPLGGPVPEADGAHLRFDRTNYAVTPDGRSVLFIWQGALLRLSLESGAVEASAWAASGQYDVYMSGHLSPDAQAIVTVGQEMTPRAWRASDLLHLSDLVPPTRWHTHQGYGLATRVAFSPDGALLACGGYDGNVTIWDAHRHDVLATYSVSQDPVFAVWFSDNGRLLVALDSGGTVRLIRTESEDRSSAEVSAWVDRVAPWVRLGSALTTPSRGTDGSRSR